MKRTEKQKLLKAQDSKKIKKHIHRKRGSQRGPLIQGLQEDIFQLNHTEFISLKVLSIPLTPKTPKKTQWNSYPNTFTGFISLKAPSILLTPKTSQKTQRNSSPHHPNTSPTSPALLPHHKIPEPKASPNKQNINSHRSEATEQCRNRWFASSPLALHMKHHWVTINPVSLSCTYKKNPVSLSCPLLRSYPIAHTKKRKPLQTGHKLSKYSPKEILHNPHPPPPPLKVL